MGVFVSYRFKKLERKNQNKIRKNLNKIIKIYILEKLEKKNLKFIFKK